jgi:uncharacterized membrane protein (DUF106 family)
MGAARKFAIILNTIYGFIGWAVLFQSPGVGIIIIALNLLIFWALIRGGRKEAARKQLEKQREIQRQQELDAEIALADDEKKLAEIQEMQQKKQLELQGQEQELQGQETLADAENRKKLEEGWD